MRVAIVGDTHSDSQFVANVIKLVKSHKEPVQTIIQLGDFGYTFDRNMIASIAAWLARDPLNTWIWLDGNHDEHNFLDDVVKEGQDLTRPINMGGMTNGKVTFPDRLFYAPRGSTVRLGNSKCMFLGGAYSIDEHYRTPQVSWWPQEMVREADLVAVEAAGVVDVMFTHDTPTNPTVDNMLSNHGYKVDAQSASNREMLNAAVRMARPVELYHGHYHWRYDGLHTTEDGWECDVHGVGANVSERGYIDHNAYWEKNVLFRDL